MQWNFCHIKMTYGPKRLWGPVKVDCRVGYDTFLGAASAPKVNSLVVDVFKKLPYE